MNPIGRRWAPLLASICLSAVALGQAAVAFAQAPNQAGLVILYGDGTVSTYCVAFAESEITGLQLLQRAGLQVVYSSSGAGDLLCKIGSEGCDNPSQCLCQCKGAQCAYWSYWHLNAGTWQYSLVGASTYRVSPGAIDGWAWGVGTVAGAPQPPVVTFDEICGPVAPAASPTQAFTPTPLPSPTDTPSAAPIATDTPRPSPSLPASPTGPASVTATPSLTVPPSSTTPPSPTVQPSPTASAGQALVSATIEASPTAASSPSPTPPAQPPAKPGVSGYVVFAAIAVVLVIVGLIAWRRGRIGL